MIGHGRPSNRFAVFVRLALASRGARAIGFFALLWILNTSVGEVALAQSNAEPSGLGLRIVWGGGEPATWVGSITLSSGEFDRLVPLGLSRDDNSTVWLSGPKLNVRQWLPGTYNGCDVRVNANRDATLSFDFTNKENPAAHWTRQITLRELIAEPVTFDLDTHRNRISIERSPGDELQVDFEQDHLIFATKSTVRLSVRPVTTGFAPSAEGKLRIFSRASGTEKSTPLADVPVKANEAGEIPPLDPISLSVPETEGVYDWDIVLIEYQRRGPFNSERVVRTRRMQYVALGENPADQSAVAETWQEEFAIDPTRPERWTMRRQLNQLKLPTRYPPVLASGASIQQVNDQAMTQLAPKGWQAIALPIDQPNQPHFLEIEYLASQPLSLGLSILETNALGAIPSLGVDSGIRVPSSTIQAALPANAVIDRHRIAFWPSTKLPYLILANHDENRTAVYGRIRVLKGPQRLEASNTEATASNKNIGRPRMLFLERPTFAQAMNAVQVLDQSQNNLFDDWTTIYTGADRLIQYLKANRYTGLVMTVAADGSAIFPSQRLQPTPRWDAGIYFSTGQDAVRKDVLQLLFRMFDRAGLQLIPVVEFSGRLPGLESQRNDSLSASFDLVNSDGQVWGAERTQSSRPPYNPLNPSVQAELAQLVDELTERYARFESFGGVAIGVNERSVLAFPDVTWGWDEVSAQEFVSSAAVGQPLFRNASTGEQRRLLLEQHKPAWIQWRTQRIASLLSTIQSAVQNHSSTAKLYLIPLDESPEVVPIRSIAEAVDVTPQADRLNQFGLDSSVLRTAEGVIVLDGIAAGHLESASTLETSPDNGLGSQSLDRAGVLFTHDSSWVHFEQFEKQNPFGVTAPIVRMQQLTPAGLWNRRRYAVALARADRTILLDGGSTIPQGQEAATADWAVAFSALPKSQFETVPPPKGGFATPLVVRQYRNAAKSYFYAVNHSPWPLDVEVDLTGAELGSLRSLTAQKPADVLYAGSRKFSVIVPPFDIFVASINGAAEVSGYRANLPPQSVNQMQREIQDLKAKLANVEPSAAKSLLENPSFESAVNGEELQGWQVDADTTGKIALDRVEPYDGGSSLLMHSDGELIRVRSNQFTAPQTGRLSISVWMRPDPAVAFPPIRLSVEAANGDQVTHRSTDITQPSESESSEIWKQYVAHFDDLPADAREFRIGFDLSDPGTVRIDRVEIHDRWLDQSEVQSLKQLLNLASYKLQEQGDAVGCLRILESHWPRFVDDQFNLTPPNPLEAARLPESSTPGSIRLK